MFLVASMPNTKPPSPLRFAATRFSYPVIGLDGPVRLHIDSQALASALAQGLRSGDFGSTGLGSGAASGPLAGARFAAGTQRTSARSKSPAGRGPRPKDQPGRAEIASCGTFARALHAQDACAPIRQTRTGRSMNKRPQKRVLRSRRWLLAPSEFRGAEAGACAMGHARERARA